MSTVHPSLTELNDVQRRAVFEELNQILADSTFIGSKRCQILLRALVERTLAGNLDGLKERALGVEVFGRAPGYDTVADPVVRMAAGEVRKRLAQWYMNSECFHPVKIRLVAGSYLPEFRFETLGQSPLAQRSNGPGDLADLSLDSALSDAHVKPKAKSGSWRRFKAIWAAAAALLLAVAVTAGVLHSFGYFGANDYQLWRPLLTAKAPVVLCVSDAAPILDPNTDQAELSRLLSEVISTRQVPPAAKQPNAYAITSMSDAEVANKIASWLSAHGGISTMRPSSRVELRDFRQGPVVLIGAFSNPWSLVMMSRLRFSTRVDPVTQEVWIQDSQNPAQRQWRDPGNWAPLSVDYGLITRYRDPETGNWILALGGLRAFGTQAAGDLLTDKAYVRLLPQDVHSQKNFQIVLKTAVINGNPGPPEILAVHFW